MRYLMMILFLILLLGANFYVFYRIWHLLPENNILRTILVVFGVIVTASFFLSMLGRDLFPSPLITFMYRFGTSWFFIFFYLLIIFLILDLIRITHLLPIGKYMFHNWLGFGVIAGVVTIIMSLGYIKYWNKERVELNISVDKPINSTQPIKIVAISDLHLGYGIGKKEFEKWVQLINKEKPDLVLIAGDAIDNNVRPLFEHNFAEVFQKINSRYGIYLAFGNHEYISSVSKSLSFFEEANVNVLRDSAVLINDSFYVIGRDDRSNPQRKSIEELISNLDKNKPLILLDHQPYHLEEAENNHIDLQISGHTHRGQVIPISWITDAIYEKSHGYLKKGNTNIYVSSGIGIWGGKFRIGSQSEYVVVHLTGIND